MAKSKALKALASGPSKIGAKARAAATKLQSGAPKGRHALTDSLSISKNNRGSYDAPSTGRHSYESGNYHPVHEAATPTTGVMNQQQAMLTRSGFRNQGKPQGKVLNMNEAMSTRRAGRKQEGTVLSLNDAVAARRSQRNRGREAA